MLVLKSTGQDVRLQITRPIPTGTEDAEENASVALTTAAVVAEPESSRTSSVRGKWCLLLAVLTFNIVIMFCVQWNSSNSNFYNPKNPFP